MIKLKYLLGGSAGHRTRYACYSLKIALFQRRDIPVDSSKDGRKRRITNVKPLPNGRHTCVPHHLLMCYRLPILEQEKYFKIVEKNSAGSSATMNLRFLSYALY